MPETSERTALYRLFDWTGVLLYVGISNNPESRFRQHRTQKSWWAQVDGISFEWFESRYKPSLADSQAISTESPRHNIHQTDPWRARQRADALAVSPEKRRNRSVGLKARHVQVQTFRDLTAKGVPENEAKEQARLARERYIEAARLASADSQRA